MSDKEIVSILATSLKSQTIRDSKEIVKRYVNEGLGILKITPTDILIDGCKINEDEIQGTNLERIKALKSLFDLGK